MSSGGVGARLGVSACSSRSAMSLLWSSQRGQKSFTKNGQGESMQGGLGIPKSCKVLVAQRGDRQRASRAGATTLARPVGNGPYERRSQAGERFLVADQ